MAYVQQISHWQSATNSAITAETWSDVETLRVSNPSDSDYQFWIQVYEIIDAGGE